MTDTSAQILGFGQGFLLHCFYIFVRISAMVSLLPAFGEQSVPVRVKLGIAIAFTIFCAPILPLNLEIEPNFGQAVWTILAESVNGLALGLGVRLFIMALQTAGSIAGQSTSLSQLLGGATSEPTMAFGQVFVIGGIALAAMTGLHVKVTQLTIMSYDFLPSGVFPAAGDLSRWGIGQISSAFSFAFQLSAPFVLFSMLYNLTLGAIGRAMPQLMVAFVGAPVITAGGLFLLFLVAPLVLSLWADELSNFLANPFFTRN